MDIFPIDKKEVLVVSQYLKLAPPGFLEKTYDPPDESLFEINNSDNDDDVDPDPVTTNASATNQAGQRKRTDYQKMGEERFLSLRTNSLRTVETYDFDYGKNKTIQWEILKDGVNVTKEEDPLLMLAAVTESDVGVENLWKKGKSKGRHNFANFGKYMPQNMFKMWQASAVYMFSDKKD
jgi:hypothetical protein